MTRVTAYNIIHAIAGLNRSVDYNYINQATQGRIRIVDVQMPGGPITIRRWNPRKGESPLTAINESISQEMIWRIANAISENVPINFDRVLGGSYNTRSVLETLMAHTPEFYFCYPGRVKDIDGHTTIEKGHKHLIWMPSNPHEYGVLRELKVPNMAVSEIPTQSIVYDNLMIPDSLVDANGMNIDVVRRHTQIQIALYLIGKQLGFRTWIAQNDRGILYQDKPLLEHPGVMPDLNEGNAISGFPGAAHSARLIDCIWFQNHRFMPAVMEVEHTTGVTSGLTRMQGLQQNIPSLQTRYVIVAPDDDRQKVVDEINRPQFRDLDARYFSYSSVEELYYICSHRHLRGVGHDFLDCYIERVCDQTRTSYSFMPM